jgi:arginase family enzyme
MSNSITADVVSFTKRGEIILVSLDAHGDLKNGWKKRKVTGKNGT